MNPLDLLKVKFQVSTCGPGGSVRRGIWCALRDIHASTCKGWHRLYRIGDSIFSCASRPSVVLFPSPLNLPICSYHQLKRHRPLSASQYLLFSAEVSPHSFFLFHQPPTFLTLTKLYQAVTAILTNPI
ncbi:hypothetical protein EDB84DRAFT_1471684 [Lactarius hengduanensis]|nr:hypothetical protein EDB84DRAFT_1471684 [Lactarius hengduanensis]